MKFLTAALVVLVAATPASAQLTGHISLIVDAFPDLDGAPARQPVTELRARIFAERHDDIGRHLRVHLAGYVDALLADRTKTGGRATTSDAIVRPADLYVELAASRIELRVGASRIAWGRLDEFQPTDVVNPIDLSRFIMEGRSEARLPVGLARTRVFLPKSTTIEAVVVPAFDEAASIRWPSRPPHSISRHRCCHVSGRSRRSALKRSRAACGSHRPPDVSTGA